MLSSAGFRIHQTRISGEYIMRITPVVLITSLITLLGGPAAWAQDPQSGTVTDPDAVADTEAGKRPGRAAYGDITLKRGVIEEGGSTEAQIDPPSLDIVTGPAGEEIYPESESDPDSEESLGTVAGGLEVRGQGVADKEETEDR